MICLNINNDITIDKNSNFDASNSSNLIGSSEIAVFGDHKIIIKENVKVEMDGMNIYNPIDDRWKGIIVRGNGTQDDAFGLEMFDGCSIRGAEVSISQNVYMTGGSSDFPENRTNFTNNESFSSNISFIARGENNFTLLQNTFTNSGFSNFISNSGGEENQITLNEFNNSNYGDVLTRDNLLTLFSANCYTNQTFADVYISGTIPDQGTQTSAPGNCFSGGSVEELRTSSSADNFTYYVPKQGITGYQPCHLVNSSGNFNIEDSAVVV